MPKKVIVVIVNYKTPYLTIDSLHSISASFSRKLDLSVTIADNNSNDGSFSIISNEIYKRGWESWVSIIKLHRNGGFAYGNNRVIQKILSGPSPPDYLWLLNPDTLIKRNACYELSNFLDFHSDTGIVGSYIEDPSGKKQISCFRDHTIISEFLSGIQLGVLDLLFKNWVVPVKSFHRKPHQADWVSGASMMIRKDVFYDIGLLDEKYFMYYEEADFCYRARQAGWKIFAIPKSKIIHIEGASTNNSYENTDLNRKPFYWFESRRRYFLKNFGKRTLLLSDIVRITGYIIWKTRKIIQLKKYAGIPYFSSDLIRNSFLFKGLNL